MIKIALAESGLNTRAFNPEFHQGCQGSYGLFQIACVNYNGNLNDLYNPEINIQVAKKILETQGYKAWAVCTNGKVDCGVVQQK